MAHEYTFTLRCPYHDYNYRDWPGGRFLQAHCHDYFQLIHVLEGDFAVDTGSGWQVVRPGSVHLLPPGFFHALRTGRGHLQFGLNLVPGDDERGWNRRLLSAFPEPCQIPASLTVALSKYLLAPATLVDELTQLQLIALLDGYCLALLTGRTQSALEREKRRLLEFLEANATVPLNVAEIAAAMQMSRASLQRFCAEVFGCGAAALHERIRIEHAGRLLLAADLPVGECARQAGFHDIYSFSRTFKRRKGCSPTQFRKTHLHF